MIRVYKGAYVFLDTVLFFMSLRYLSIIGFIETSYKRGDDHRLTDYRESPFLILIVTFMLMVVVYQISMPYFGFNSTQ